MTEAIRYGDQFHKAAEKYIRDGEELPKRFLYAKDSLDALKRKRGDKLCEYRMGLTEDLEPCGFFDYKVWYRGIVDLLIIDKENKQAVIIDYKTGKNPQYADVNQLELMTLAVFKHFPEVENVKAGLYFFTKTQLIKETYDKTKEPDLWAKWLEQVNELKSCYDNDVWNPKPNFSCSRFCPVESCEHNGRY